jgi:hypothetical protein
MKNSYNILVTKPGRKNPLERYGWEVNVAMELKNRVRTGVL